MCIDRHHPEIRYPRINSPYSLLSDGSLPLKCLRGDSAQKGHYDLLLEITACDMVMTDTPGRVCCWSVYLRMLNSVR